MRKITTDKAVGKILAYDTTLVTPKESSTLLKRGHKITESDVERLKNSGVYQVWTEDEDNELIYEWDISFNVAKQISDGETTEIRKGRHGITFLISKVPGLIQVDHERLARFNHNKEVLIMTQRENTAVAKGEVVAAIDVIPLGIKKEKMTKISGLAVKGMARVLPFKLSKIGLIITGTEIYEKRKKDHYYRIIKEKCAKYGWKITYREIVPDERDREVEAIKRARTRDIQAIIVTGGMSVDPTDKTPDSIKKLGAKIIAYGVPMKPTTMTLIATWSNLPIFGISAGGIHYSDFNSIDVLFTRIMAGKIPTEKEIDRLGDGGIFSNYVVQMKNKSNLKTSK